MKLDVTRRASVDGYASTCCDLDPWPLIPKVNQHIYEPKYICDQNLVKFPSLVCEIRCSQHFRVVAYPLPSARQHPSYGDWKFRGNITRTALCWIVWHNVHSQQHTYVSSSYRSNRLGLSHWDPYAVRRGSCLELYYGNMVGVVLAGFKPDIDDQQVSFSALILLVRWSRL